MRKGDFPGARALFEEAGRRAATDAEKTRALIHQACVAIFAGEPSPLIHELPKFVLSRADPLNVWLSAFYYGNYLIDEKNKRTVAAKYLTVIFEQLPSLERTHYYAALSFDFACALALAERKFDDARRFASRASEDIALCEPADDVAAAAAMIEHNLGYSLLGFGRPDEAIPHLRAGLEALESLGADRARADVHVNLAFAYLLSNDVPQSELHLDRLERYMDATSEWLRPYLLYLRAEIAQRRDDAETAERIYDELQQYDPRFRGLSKVLSRVSLLPIILPERY
jgi:tetratricopeptide (TPR) repeat protein